MSNQTSASSGPLPGTPGGRPIRILICGANGKMGQTVKNTAASHSHLEVVAGVDKYKDILPNPFPVFEHIEDCDVDVDVIIDFSRPDALEANLAYATKHNTPMVIATTGFSDSQKSEIMHASQKAPLFFSANMSLGVNLQMDLAKRAASFLNNSFDVEIIEKHHNQKVDAPSGTALALADRINEAFLGAKKYVCGRESKNQKRTPGEIGIHAIRGGTVVGEHQVLFLGNDEVFEITHIAQSKQIFAVGAIKAAEFLIGKGPGLYSMKDIVGEHSAVTSVHTDGGQAVIAIRDLPNTVQNLAKVFGACEDINLDMICQVAKPDRLVDISFSLPAEDLETGYQRLKQFFPQVDIYTTNAVTKIMIEGMGMEFKPGVASQLFTALAAANISVKLITTSETKIALCVNTQEAQKALMAISSAFPLS